jgi:nucleoside-diphosphate-sugar epimerase
MRVVFIGGTNFVGPVGVRLAHAAGHHVAVAHTGMHEADLPDVEHFHGPRDELLAPDGPVERWRPEVVVDTFAGGATGEKARQLEAAAKRASVRQLVAVSSIDVYQYCVDAGLSDMSGAVPFPSEPLPLREESPLRKGPYPGGSPAHDNVAMETALQDGGQRVTVLRPGTIYGPHPDVREWTLVEAVARGERELKLPDGGTQIFHRVAVERVGRAIVAAFDRAPDGFWACNIVDPYDWTYAGLAAEIAELLNWEWHPSRVPFDDTEHPWQTAHPVLCCDRRLREVLQVLEPDPRAALAETVDWLWEHRERPSATAPRRA